MLDRYTKAVLTVIAASLLVLATDSLLGLLPAARAEQPTRKRCVWTYLPDAGSPNLGKDGEVKLERGWQKVSDGGWELKGMTWAVNQGLFVFEKCESQ